MIVKFMGRGVAAAMISFSLSMPVAAETLAQTLASAYKHSGLLEQNRAVLRAADENVAQAVAALRPVLSWSANATRNFGSQSSASSQFRSVAIGNTSTTIALIAQVTLYDGGANRLTVSAQKEAVLATRATLEAVEQDVLLRAAEAFMEVQRAEQNVSLRNNNVRVIRQELRAARDRFEVGEVTRTDVSLAEARLSSARSAQATAEGNLRGAIEEFRSAVGRKPGKLSTPKRSPRVPGSVAAAKRKAVKQHPDMIRVQRLVKANEISIAIAKAAMRPTVTLNGRLSATENFDNRATSRNGSVSVEATGPIYQGGRLSSLVREAMADRDESRGQLHVTRHNVQQNVGNAFVRLEVARANIKAFKDQVRAARVAFQGVREEATLGARTTLDVLDAEQELLDAQSSLVSAEVDEMIAAYNVLASVGDLTAAKLKLKVPQYDPTEYYNLVKDGPAISQQGEKLNRVLKALGKN